MSRQPLALRIFNCWIDGVSYLGKVTEVTLPDLTLVYEKYKGGGYDAPRAIELGMEELVMEFTIMGANKNIMKRFGMVPGNQTAVRLKPVYKTDNQEEEVEIVGRGYLVDLKNAGVKLGEMGSMKAKFSLTYYRYDSEGELIHEIDVDNFRRVVDGIDQLASLRRKAEI